MIPIVQQVVVESHIAGIESHDEYGELRATNTSAENKLMQKFQAFRNKVRELVIPFFQEGHRKDPVVQEIKWKVFGVAVDGNILDDEHPVAQALLCARFQATRTCLFSSSVCAILQVNIGCSSVCLKPRKMHRKDLKKRVSNLVSHFRATVMRSAKRQYWIFSVSCLYVLQVPRLL